MINIQKYNDLGHQDFGWLNARHHFSFGHYYNPSRLGFAAIRVINDDIIKAGTGFDTHPHKDMEIITYVREGAITHKDNKGNRGRTQAGDVQVMSAGTGIWHSEYNFENEDTNIYQIWIEPNKLGVQPRWQTHPFPKENHQNELSLLVSGTADAPLFINQNADIYAGILKTGAKIKQKINHNAYVLVSQGQIKIDGQDLFKGDGCEIKDKESITIEAINHAEVLVIDVADK